jgi:hypothetical protein
MSDMIDLLPCPFCGGPDTRHFNNPDEFGRPSHGIQCANGECWVCGPECETPSEAIAAWNRRAPLPPAPDAVEALVKAGWDAARKSVYALCEDIEDSAHDALKAELSEHQAGFHSAERFTAKRIRRAMGSMEAGDDDNFRAALAALRALGGDA